MNPSEIKETLSILDTSNRAYVSPGIDIVLITNESLTDFREHIASVYTYFLKEFGNELTFCGYDGKWKEATQAQKEKLTEWLEDPKMLKSATLSYIAHSGAGKEGYWSPAPPYFELFYEQDDDPVGKLRISFPVDYSQDKILQFIESNVANCPIVCGHGGYALLFDENSAWNKNWTGHYAGLLKRFPGLVFSEDAWLEEIACLDRKIGIVNWLTFIGKDLAEEIGDSSKIQQDLGPEFNVIDLNESLCIVAGEAPQLGAENAESLPLYMKVGNYLDPIVIDSEMIEEMGVAGMEREEDVAWLIRFFKTD